MIGFITVMLMIAYNKMLIFTVLPHLELKPNCNSDRAWVWSTPADFADEEPKPELLAIRFANAESKCNL